MPVTALHFYTIASPVAWRPIFVRGARGAGLGAAASYPNGRPMMQRTVRSQIVAALLHLGAEPAHNFFLMVMVQRGQAARSPSLGEVYRKLRSRRTNQ